MARQMQTTPFSGTFDGALKHWYEPVFKSMLTELFPWYDWLKKEKRINREPNIQGDMIYFGTTVRRSSAVGARGEMQLLPTIDQADVVQGYLDYMTGFKGRIGVSAEAMKYGRKGKGSFVDLVQQEMDEIMNAMKESASVAAWGAGDGICGRTANASGGTAQNTFTSSEISTECYPGTRWLHEGKEYLPVQSTVAYAADGTLTTGTGMLSIDSDTLATFDATVTTDAAARLWVEGETATNGSVTVGTASSYTGPMGFLAMVDDGTFKSSYCAISESTYPRWKANILANGGTKRALSMSLFYRAFFKTVRKAGIMKPSHTGWLNPDMLLAIVDLLEHYVEFKARKLEAGFDEVDVMVDGQIIKLKVDPYCPGYIFLIDAKEVDFYETIPLEIADEHGSEWFPIANYDGYEARVRWNWQLATKSRHAHAGIQDITYSVVTM
jgi:hypothetical protein